MKKKIISIALAIAVTGCGSAAPATESATAQTTTEASTTVAGSSVEATVVDKKAELKEQYGLSEPKEVPKDTTGKWRLSYMSGLGQPIDFAFDYYKNFMEPDQIHFIINTSDNTTTSIQNMAGMLYAKVMEHVEGEEADASKLGSGAIVQEKYFNLETGEPYEAEASSDVAPVSADELIAKVSEILPSNISEGTEIKGIEMKDGNNLYITIDISHVNDNSSIQFPLDSFAEASISNITDPILALDDSYYNAWDTITVDFLEQGHATFDKSDVTANALGRYFSYEGNVLKK